MKPAGWRATLYTIGSDHRRTYIVEKFDADGARLGSVRYVMDYMTQARDLARRLNEADADYDEVQRLALVLSRYAGELSAHGLLTKELTNYQAPRRD